MSKKAGLSRGTKGAIAFTLILAAMGLSTFFQGDPPETALSEAESLKRFVLQDGREAPPLGDAVALRVILNDQGQLALAPWPLGESAASESALLTASLPSFASAPSLLLFLDLAPSLGVAEENKALEQILATLKQSSRAPDQVILASANWLLLDDLAKRAASYRLGYASSEQPGFDTVQRRAVSSWIGLVDWAAVEGSLPQLVRQRGGDLWLPHFRDLRQVDLDEAKALGLEVYVWPVEQKDVAQGLEAIGVDGILLSQGAR